MPDTTRTHRTHIHRPSRIPITRRIKSKPERAVEPAVPGNKRPRVIPRIPIPSRAIPPGVRDHNSLRVRLIRLGHISGPELTPVVEIIGPIAVEFVRLDLGAERELLAFADLNAAVVVQDLHLAIEYRHHRPVGVKPINSPLL